MLKSPYLGHLPLFAQIWANGSFAKKSGSVTFLVFWTINLIQITRKNYEPILRKYLNVRMVGAKFIGLSSLRPGVQKEKALVILPLINIESWTLLSLCILIILLCHSKDSHPMPRTAFLRQGQLSYCKGTYLTCFGQKIYITPTCKTKKKRNKTRPNVLIDYTKRNFKPDLPHQLDYPLCIASTQQTFTCCFRFLYLFCMFWAKEYQQAVVTGFSPMVFTTNNYVLSGRCSKFKILERITYWATTIINNDH